MPRKITIRCPKCAWDIGELSEEIVECGLCGHRWAASEDERKRGGRTADDHPWKILFDRPDRARYYNRVSPVDSGRLCIRVTATLAAMMNLCIEDLGVNKTELVERAVTHYMLSLKDIREAEGHVLGRPDVPLALGGGD